MNNLRNFLKGVIMHPYSNKLIGDFQRLCGVKSDKDMQYKSTFLYYYFKLCSMTGEELYSLMPILFWLTIPLGPSYILNFGLICTIGQLLKDFVKLPRPPANGCGGIVRIEKQHETEYGFPSTHTMGALLPMSVLLSLRRLHIDVHTGLFVMAIYHVVAIGLSRLYLGVHSVVDLVGGIVIGVPMMILIDAYEPELEQMLIFGPHSIYVTITLLIAFLFFYPKGDCWTASYGTSAQFFGTYAGVSSAMWYCVNGQPAIWETLNNISLLIPMSQGDYSGLLSQVTLMRVGVGLVICGLCKVLGKAIPMYVLAYMVDHSYLIEDKKYTLDALANKVHTHKLYCVEIPARLMSYGLLAWGVFVITPMAWDHLNL